MKKLLLVFGLSGFGLHVMAHSAISVSENAGAQRLGMLLDLHCSGVVYDDSIYNYDWSKPFSRVAYERHLIENMPAINLHYDAIAIFRGSKWLEQQFFSSSEPICRGMQLLEGLEVVAGKLGNKASYLTDTLGLAQSAFGKVSAALLVADPQSTSAVLLPRQEVVKKLCDDEQLYADLTGLYGEFVQTERYFLPTVRVTRHYGNEREIGPEMLILQIPVIRKLYRSPAVRTVDDVYREITMISSYKRTGFGLCMLLLYAYYARKSSRQSGQITGPGLSHDDSVVITKSKNLMQPDVAFLWDRISNNKAHAFLAALAVGYGIKSLYQQIKWRIDDYKWRKFSWECLTKASRGFALMREIYTATAHVEAFRALPDCAIVYDFFERQLKEDAELAELFGLFESLPLNKQTGSALFSGYVNRAQELLKKKARMVADLAVGIGRIEVYLGLAKLMLRSRTAPNENQYTF